MRDAAENRSDNTTANNYIPVRGSDFFDPQWGPNFGMDSRASAFSARIDGNFRGTTDEIIQWGACKWGFDEDIVRAVAIAESFWHQSQIGDNGESFGLLQVRKTYHPGTYPAAEKSTAYNVDYALAYRRSCFEGWLDWLHDYTSDTYTAGNEWGCVGHWFSGRWTDDAGGQNYTATVQRHLNEKVWRESWF